MVSHFGDSSFPAVNCSGTDDGKQTE